MKIFDSLHQNFAHLAKTNVKFSLTPIHIILNEISREIRLSLLFVILSETLFETVFRNFWNTLTSFLEQFWQLRSCVIFHYKFFPIIFQNLIHWSSACNWIKILQNNWGFDSLKWKMKAWKYLCTGRTGKLFDIGHLEIEKLNYKKFEIML